MAPDAPAYVMDGDWDTPYPGMLFEDLDVHRSMQAHFSDGVEWVDTPLFARVSRNLSEGQIKWGCRTPDEYEQRLKNKIDPLYQSIQTDGFKSQVELDTGKPSDEIRIAIDRTGRPLFVDGRHRLAIAKVLGLTSIPVRIILRHAEWVDFQESIWAHAKTARNKVYQKIDHPDLAFFPAHHNDARFEMLKASLGDYDPTGKTLIDIGTHWGHMCHKFEELGFECTAVELLKGVIPFLTGIRDANERDFHIWHGNIFDFPDVEDMNVVVAVNILHHFCKTEEEHAKLVTLLQRMRGADLMFFQPHKHDPPGQMKDAYRNYPEDEFVNFVCEHTGFDQQIKLGVASDGRALYKLWRSA